MLVQCMAHPAGVHASRVEKDGQTFAVKVPERQQGMLRMYAADLQKEAAKSELLAPMKRGVVRVLFMKTVTDINTDLQLPLLFMK